MPRARLVDLQPQPEDISIVFNPNLLALIARTAGHSGDLDEARAGRIDDIVISP